MLTLALRTTALSAALAASVMLFAGEVLVTGIILVAAGVAGTHTLLARVAQAPVEITWRVEGDHTALR